MAPHSAPPVSVTRVRAVELTMKLLRFTHLAVFIPALSAAALSQATVNGTTLQVLGSAGGDVIAIRFDSAPGSVQVFGVPGTPDGAQFAGIAKLQLATLAGFDIVDVQVQSSALPELAVDTGSGDSQVKLRFSVPSTVADVTSLATVTGGAANDQVEFEVSSDAASMTMNWNVIGGDGTNDAVVKFTSDALGGATALNWRYAGGSQVDKVLLDLTTRADQLAVAALTNTGGGADEFIVKGVGDTNTTAVTQLLSRLGAGADKAVIDISNVGRTFVRGAIDGGLDADTIELSTTSSLSGSPLILGGDGNDTLVFTVDGTLRAGSAPRIFAGNGNDSVSMLVWGSLLGSPFCDGGAGFDIFQGVGATANFEVIN